jgi:hypothetical protein
VGAAFHEQKKGRKPEQESIVYAPAVPIPRKRKVAEVSNTKKEIEWVSFNYPLQADVLLAYLDCRKAFNKWALLGRALGLHSSITIKKKHGINIQWNKGGMCVPSIVTGNGSVYYPPMPGKSWKKSNFKVTEEGKVSFPSEKVATSYTILQFLMDTYPKGMEEYFSKTIASANCEYIPEKYKVGSRMCDPIKMVVFYDSDDQQKLEPMAVCLLLRNNQGAFALVDDFGRIIQDTTFRFLVSHRVFRSISY